MTLIKDPQAPATPAQVNYLADLVKNRDLPAVAEKYRLVTTIGTLQKGLASEWITALLAAPKKAYQAPKSIDQQVAEHDTALAASVQTLVQKLTELPAYGYYMIDGTLYYWDVTGKDVKPVLRRLQIVTNYDGSQKGSWKKVYGGTTAHLSGKTVKAQAITATYLPYNGKGWTKTEVTQNVWVPGVLVNAVQAGVQPLSQDAAGKLGKQFGFCVRCGATLTDPVSVANGIGPVCAKYWA